MTWRAQHRDPLVHAGQFLALAVAYVALGKLGLAIVPVSGFATLIWPPTGLCLAALLIGGLRLWPGVALGALVTNLWVGAPLHAALGIAVGNTLEAVAGAYALRRFLGFHGSLDRFTDVIGLMLVAVLSTTLSATLGVASLTLSGVASMGDFTRAWLVWWTGDLISDLIVAPLLLSWALGPRLDLRLTVILEAAALGGLLVAFALLVFVQPHEAVTNSPILHPYLLLMLLVGVALRFGARGAATGTLVVAVAAIVGTDIGRGAFARPDRIEGLLTLHVFLGATSVGSLALGSVMSERERARRALEANRSTVARLAAIVESSADAVIGMTVDGTVTSWNAAAERIYGYAPEEILGRSIAMLVLPSERDELAALFRRVEGGERIQNLEGVRLRKDGRTIETATTLSPIRDVTGVVVGISKIARDITERKRVQRQLLESEERQRLAAEAAHLGMWFWDLKNDRLTWTWRSWSMHGFAADGDMNAGRFLTMVHPEDRERVDRALTCSLAAHAEYRVEYRVTWRDGNLRWLLALGSPFYDEAGRPDRMLGVVLDITEQKRVEQERADLLGLEQAARAEAQAATLAKDAFLANLSHELRTPLQSILGWTQILRSRPFDAMAQRGLASIERNAKAQAQLIEDLLDVSRIIAGKLRLDETPADLVRVVEAALDATRLPAQAKSIRMDVRLDPSVAESAVMGDPARLQQVVSNLLTNAVKFTPPGGLIRVTLSSEAGAATIAVEDTGCGISAEFLPRVFERFQQANGTSKRTQSGLGLGLAIVHDIVKMHGGTVKAASPGAGQGSTFTVTLPLVDVRPMAVAAEREPPNDAAPSPEPAVASLSGVRVLVVDDDPDACELLDMALRGSGAEVHTVQSASAALDDLASFHPGLVISDLAMPGGDGYALIQQIRAREATATAASGAAGEGHVTAVALTGCASPADRRKALASGFDEYIAKPASPEEIARTVAGLVKRAA